ncbi:MAG TPA: hypothetical protein VHA56_19650 [Mucilaginibacter sp.]|nr:hypothetical protein [Mucilaginibacter sp.]
MKKIKKTAKIILLLIVVAGVLFSMNFFIRELRVVRNNKQISTKHFFITYKGILNSEAADMAKSLETNYTSIRTDLHDPGHGKIAVYVHPAQSDFNKATGLIHSKANGTSRGPLVIHLMYQTWYNSFLPADMNKVAVHEFTHCVQLSILIQDALSKTGKDSLNNFDKKFERNFSANYPRWFWEGLSDYEANMVNKISVKYGMRNEPTLAELNHSNQVYNVGYTIPEYLVSKYGKDKLPEFIRSYCNFEQVLGVSEKEFETGWHQFLDENY